MAKIKSPKIYDPYLGAMYGNILDQYDNPAYNLKLYMKPETVGTTPTGSSSAAISPNDPRVQAAVAAGVSPEQAIRSLSSGNVPSGSPLDPNLANSGTGARSDTPNSSASSAAPTDKRIVVLAQTGVTANQIDNLELTGYMDPSSVKADSPTTKGTFTIIQPGAATFIDQIQWARKYLGASDDKLTSTDFDMYLDITFLGYDSDIDDVDNGGEPTQITEVFTYVLKPLSIKVKVDNTGSQYEFEVAIANTTGYADTIYKLPQGYTLTGATITEMVKSLETQFNTSLTSMSTEYIPDEVAFNLDPLLKGSGAIDSIGATAQDYIKDETIPHAGNSEKVETRTQPRYNVDVAQTASQQQQQADGAASAGSSPERIIDKATLAVKEGDTIFQVIGSILLQNKEFQAKVSRKEDVNDPGNNKVRNDQTFIQWYDIYCQVENIKWDKKRNMYAKKYTYTPYIVKDARSDVALTTTEFDYLKEKSTLDGSDKEIPLTALATKRLQDLYNNGFLSKSYFYIFTGLNDQIINLDINYDNALTLLMPPKGGMAGDFSVTNSTALTNSEPRTKDMTLGDKLEAAKKTSDLSSLVDVFKQIKGLASDMNGLAQSLGRSVEQINAAVNDASGRTAIALAQSLDGATVNRTLRNIGVSESADPDAVPGTATQINVQNNGSYAPEVSGFLYSDDLVQPGGNLSTQEIESAGLVMLDGKAPVNVGPATPVTKSLASPLSGITSDGPASVLMGYVYRARKSTNFLLNIELTLRGDPYWLTRSNTGPFEKNKPSRDFTTNPPPGGKYYFLLTIGSPSRYDYNINDEDENTGYWSDGRTSGVFSGLFLPIEWKNRFNNGIFTTEIKATKEISVPLQWVRRVPPGEAPPNWDDLGVTDDVLNDFIAATGRTAIPPGDGGAGGNDTVTPVRPEDLGPLQFGNAKSREAKAAVERYLGRSVTDREFELVVRATIGESGGGDQEDAAVASVILNRARSNFGGAGTSIEGQLYARNQFQAVTGTRATGASRNFTDPNPQQIARATNNILTNLSRYQNVGWTNFTAYNPAAYGPGTDASYRTRALNTPGNQVLGRGTNSTIFFKEGGG